MATSTTYRISSRFTTSPTQPPPINPFSPTPLLHCAGLASVKGQKRVGNLCEPKTREKLIKLENNKSKAWRKREIAEERERERRRGKIITQKVYNECCPRRAGWRGLALPVISISPLVMQKKRAAVQRYPPADADDTLPG